MKVAALVPAAGKGRRIKSKTEKPYIKLFGKPILAHTLIKLSKNRYIDEIIVAVNKNKIPKVNREIIKRFRIKKVKLVAGGKQRKDSVFNALKNISSDIDYVLIHDCVRPFISNNLIHSSLKAAKTFGASVVCVPILPTLKHISKNGLIQHTPDRSNFWGAQTPQVFRRDLIERSYKKLGKKKLNITDDSMLVEMIGIKPKLIMGSYSNIKITTPEDLELAKLFMKRA